MSRLRYILLLLRFIQTSLVLSSNRRFNIILYTVVCIMLYWISFSSMVKRLDTRAVSTAGMRDLVQFKGYLYLKEYDNYNNNNDYCA